MLKLPVDAPDNDILTAVSDWVNYLAQERYADALSMLYPVPGNSYPWTPDLLETVITNYGFVEPRDDGRTFIVTPPEEAQASDGYMPVHNIRRYGKDAIRELEGGVVRVAHVLYDLPLNGEWSDVTAIFELYHIGDGLVLALNDVHVM